MSDDIRRKLKNFRLNLLVMSVILIVPVIVYDYLVRTDPDIGNNPVFIVSIFFYIFLGTVIFFRFTHMKCPRCGQGYFTKTGLPKLMYGFRCQNCGFNVFRAYKQQDD